jgi:hypothetical protein
VPLQWSFPRTTKFDHTIHLTVPTVTAQGNTTSSAPSSGDVWGDISSTATTAEKSVGQSWSDPAVGQVLNSSGKFTVIVGSGYLPYFQQHAANRGDVIAGTTLYMLDAKTGLVDASKDIGSDGVAETVDDCASVSVFNCQIMKNALQADPVATGPPDSRFINKAYIGDLDGRIWRYNITADVSGNPSFSGEPINLFNASLVGGHGSPKKVGAAQPVFSSMASVTVGGTQQYIFFGTGSDLLSSNGVDQADERDEQPDADSDRAFEVHRDRVEDRLPEAGQHQDRDEDPLGDDHAHRVGERQPVVGYEGERDERVQPEPCCERERVVRVHAHRDRHDACDERGYGEDLREGEALLLQAGDADEAEDRGVHEQDVGHRQPRGRTRDDLGADRGAPIRDVEIPVQPARASRRSFRPRHTGAPFSRHAVAGMRAAPATGISRPMGKARKG